MGARPAREAAAHCTAQRARKGSARGKPRLSVSPSLGAGRSQQQTLRDGLQTGASDSVSLVAGLAPLLPGEGRTRKALVLPSRSLLRASGAGNGPRLRVTAADASAPSTLANPSAGIAYHKLSGWPWRRYRIACAFIDRSSRMPAKRRRASRSKLQATRRRTLAALKLVTRSGEARGCRSR